MSSSDNEKKSEKRMIKCLNCMHDYEEEYGVCCHCGYVPGTPPKELFELVPGVIISERYIIGTAVGFGGFGIIYKAWDMVLSRIVAVKEYYPSGLSNRVFGDPKVIVYSGKRGEDFRIGLERFILEARIVSKFNSHPNIVNVYDYFQENNTGYMIMEFLEGISYKQFLKDNGGILEPEIAVKVVLSVLDALKEIHACNYIHRDISPDNIFICDNGKIKLIDFGAARFSEGNNERNFSMILKPGYAPPEQYMQKSNQGAWTDLYALGAVLYRSVTGCIPPESLNRKELDDMKPPIELNPKIPEYLNNIILRSLALDPNLRFRNTQQFKEALLEKKQIKTVEKEISHRKKRRLIGVIASVCAALGVYGVCFFTFFNQSDATTLSDASIVVWIKVGNNETEEEAIARFNTMTADFLTSYPNIKLNAQYYDGDYYDAKLNELFESGGKRPTLFDSGNLNEKYFSELANVSSIVSNVNNGDNREYYFLDKYSEYFPKQNQVPLGFNMPALYAYVDDNAIIPDEITSLDTVISGESAGSYEFYYTQILNYLSCYQNKTINKTYELNYNDVSLYDKANLVDSEEDFANGELKYLFADLSIFKNIESAASGKLKLVAQNGENLYGNFTDLYSVDNSASDEEKKAAMVLLEYLLGEQASTSMNYGSSDYGFHTLPLNKKAVTENLSVFGMSNLSKEIDKLNMIGSEYSKTLDETKRIYNQIK